MSATVSYSFPTAIHVGSGVSGRLASVLREAGSTRPAFVTDSGVSGLTWFGEMAESIGSEFETIVFDGLLGNPVLSQVEAGVNSLRQHQADAIIAVGGGAPLDVAKAIALMLHHPGHLFDYEDGLPDAPPVDGEIPYIIALPTTAGTGSEVGRSAVISDDETHTKKIIFSPRLLPSVVLADPLLTIGLPPHLTAATGFDALSHLVEAFLVIGDHPMCDGIALEGIRLVAQHLLPAVNYGAQLRDGDVLSDEEQTRHIEARTGMLNAAMMGAVAFQKGLGVNHSCAHALSTVCDTHHGLANALMLEACMRYNMESVPDDFLRMARVIDPSASRPERFLEWIVQLRTAAGLPPDLSSIGVSEEHLPALVKVALADGCHPFNPRPVSEEHFYRLFREALGQ